VDGALEADVSTEIARLTDAGCSPTSVSDETRSVVISSAGRAASIAFEVTSSRTAGFEVGESGAQLCTRACASDAACRPLIDHEVVDLARAETYALRISAGAVDAVRVSLNTLGTP
jgi:hypothetical protein